MYDACSLSFLLLTLHSWGYVTGLAEAIVQVCHAGQAEQKRHPDLVGLLRSQIFLANENNDQNANSLYRMSSFCTFPQMNKAN